MLLQEPHAVSPLRAPREQFKDFLIVIKQATYLLNESHSIPMESVNAISMRWQSKFHSFSRNEPVSLQFWEQLFIHNLHSVGVIFGINARHKF